MLYPIDRYCRTQSRGRCRYREEASSLFSAIKRRCYVNRKFIEEGDRDIQPPRGVQAEGRGEGDQLVTGHAVRTLLDQVRTPEQLTFGRGMAQATLARVQGLCSQFEWECLQRFAADQSYDEIAEHVKPGRNGSGAKAVDNALCRVRRNADTDLV